MPNYHRNYVFGGTYFFTIVTNKRIHYFEPDRHKHLVNSRIKQTIETNNSSLLAYCILPDHIHLLMRLSEKTCQFSYHIRELKRLVTLDLRKELDLKHLQIWQDRFWEHTILDEKDLERHLDYIHFNPVKHGYIDDPIKWPWSSYSTMESSGLLSSVGIFKDAQGLEKFYFGE